jgi:asparagine N-glycosylation enzyme membrane subunit Stt3
MISVIHNPFIYILLAAAIFSLILKEWNDLFFIIAVVLLNSVVGAWQENKAEKSAASLKNFLEISFALMSPAFVISKIPTSLVAPKRFLKPRTPIKNFYLTGQDIVSAGVGAALFSGVLTSSAMTGANIMKKVMS